MKRSGAPATPGLTKPTSTVPVASQVGRGIGDDDEVSRSRRDLRVAARALVGLACLIGLDRMHRRGLEDAHEPQKPHATKASVMATKTTTIITSNVLLPCLRNGLKPIRAIVGRREPAAAYL